MILVTVLYIIVCVLLIAVILIQQGKGAGLGILGGSSDTILGSNVGNAFTKTTSFFAILFILGALILSVLGSGERSAIDKADGNNQTIENPSQSTVPGIENLNELQAPTQADEPTQKAIDSLVPAAPATSE